MDINTTSPIKLFEYLAVERPIISTNLPNIRKVVNENEIIFVDNNEFFAENIAEIIYNNEKMKFIVKNGKEKVKKFTWLRRAQSLLTLIEGSEVYDN